MEFMSARGLSRPFTSSIRRAGGRPRSSSLTKECFMKMFAQVWALPLAIGAALLLPSLAQAQAVVPGQAPNADAIHAQLMAWFDKWDADKDGYLDAKELAKAFRGPYAKPYEPGPDTKGKGPSDYQFLVKCDTDG